MKSMIVKVSTGDPSWPLARQTPGSSGTWGDYRFVINKKIEKCDAWVVFGSLLKPEQTICPTNRMILITTEPETVKTYNNKFVNQFSLVSSCQSKIQHPNIVANHPPIPWMVGGKFSVETKTWSRTFTKNYDELRRMKSIKKNKLLSFITSNKK